MGRAELSASLPVFLFAGFCGAWQWRSFWLKLTPCSMFDFVSTDSILVQFVTNMRVSILKFEDSDHECYCRSESNECPNNCYLHYTTKYHSLHHCMCSSFIPLPAPRECQFALDPTHSCLLTWKDISMILKAQTRITTARKPVV